MQITSEPRTRRPAGFALIMIMVLLAVMLTVFASMMYWVSSNAKITLRNNAFTGAEAAAESATETVLAPMIRDFAYGSLNPASIYTNQPGQTGWPITYQFNNINIVIDRTHETNLSALSSEFAGLSGFVDYCTNSVTATAINGPVGVPATVQQTLEFASIPVFQYAIFYNMDLEIEPGKAMNINGHVHSNNNIWATGNSVALPLTFQNLVDATGTVYLQGSTNSSQSAAAIPGSVIFTVTQNNPLSHAQSLSMPIGTNNNPAAVAGIIQLPPSNEAAPNAAAYSPTGSIYLYNAADLIITNNAAGTNWTVLYDNPNATTQLTPVLPDVQVVVSNYNIHTSTPYYTTNAWYSFVTNATFYDYRESDTVQAIQIDVSKLDSWLTNNAALVTKIGNTTTYIGGTNLGGYQYNNLNTTGSTSKGHNINSIFVYNSVPPASGSPGTLPAVRLVNGSQLPSATLFGNTLMSGLTVATAQPLYVEGNYNVTNNGKTALTLGSTTNGGSVPAALIGDAITILSSSWSDGYNSGTSLSSRNATMDDTVNAACLEGIVPSANGANYSGGVENFLRFLENWSSTMTYNGSIVCMFPSEYATSTWQQTGIYYNPPTRAWGFDPTFGNGQASLPPLSPQAKYVIRSTYSAW
jgi:hypothetical protein